MTTSVSTHDDITLDDLKIGSARRLIFEYPWFSRLFTTCKEFGLDWVRMSAHAIVLSGGDSRARYLDWDYLEEHLSYNNPTYATRYGSEGSPSGEIIDLATRWGLFQIHGHTALGWSWSGRIINLIDSTKNIQLACRMVADQTTLIDKKLTNFEHINTPQSLALSEDLKSRRSEVAEAILLNDPSAVEETIHKIKTQVQNLLNLDQM